MPRVWRTHRVLSGRRGGEDPSVGGEWLKELEKAVGEVILIAKDRTKLGLFEQYGIVGTYIIYLVTYIHTCQYSKLSLNGYTQLNTGRGLGGTRRR